MGREADQGWGEGAVEAARGLTSAPLLFAAAVTLLALVSYALMDGAAAAHAARLEGMASEAG